MTPTTMAAETVTLTDGLDRSVSLTLPAQRIVSLAPSNTELLFEVGAGSQVVGRDSFLELSGRSRPDPGYRRIDGSI